MKISPALLLLFLPLAISSAAPISFSGKVAVNGVNLDGVAQFKFALVDQNGSVLWSHADEANASVSVNVERGHYSILLGESMNPIPSGLFLDHRVVYLQVHLNLGDGNFLHLQPDQRIVSAAHALSAVIAESAKVADAVKPGSVTREHLTAELLSDLNATISRSRLSADVLADLNRTIQRTNLASDVLADLNATILRSRLSGDVLADLNRTIHHSNLSVDLLSDLNATISRSRLSADVLADLNRTIQRTDLASDVLADLNATISRSRLSGDVLADLNRTIHHSNLSADLLSDLNATISRTRLSADVLADLNRTIQRNDLASDVLADLNATISHSRLSGDVLADLNRTITREMLPSDVLAELNASVTVSKMHPDLVKYFLPEISNHPSTVSVLKGTGATLSSSASGKFLAYQWQKGGSDLIGETNSTLVLTDVNGSWTGQYRLVVSNDWGSVTTNAATFTVATDAPLITLEGNASVTHEGGTSYSDPGATALDALNGNLTAVIVVTGSVDENQTGQNQLKYNVSDAGGNAALEKVRTVTVVDTIAPVITLVGDANVSHGLNTAWSDPGATATDSLDGNLSAQVSISGTVDVNQTGANVLTYIVSDAAGNSATSLSRTVNVFQPPSGPWNFTSAGASGRFGPTQTQIDSNYSGTALEGEVTINTQGIQEWIVPSSGTYRIEAFGAQGGSGTVAGGLGARIQGDFALEKDNSLKIIVGQQPAFNSPTKAGGGGGTFVVKFPFDAVAGALVIAGGGGGAAGLSSALSHGSINLNGNNGDQSQYVHDPGLGGSGGQGGFQGGAHAGNGGGFLGNGEDGAIDDSGGSSFQNSGTGAGSLYGFGGFGGGGGGGNAGGGGGGGGYSGGGGSYHHPTAGGGGASYNSGTNKASQVGVKSGHGKLTITWLGN